MKFKSILLAGIALSAFCFPLSAQKFNINVEKSECLFLTFDSEKESGFNLKGSPEKVKGIKDNSLLFDGQDDFIELDKSILDAKGLTFSLDIKPESWSYWQRIFDFGNGADCDVWLGYDQATKALRLAAGSASVLAPLPKVDEWTCVTVTFAEDNAALYINGKLSQKLSIGVSPEKVLQTVKGVYIGKSNWNDPMFKGMMDNIFICKRVLSEKEVLTLSKGIIDTSSIGYQK